MVEPLIKDLLEAGVHFGHQTRRWNPKMKRFIFGQKNGIYILDLEKTNAALAGAREFLRSVATQGGAILFVGTKRQGQEIIAREATRCGQFYVNLRWLGGLLTNFQTIRKSVERLKTLRMWSQDGTLDRLKKREASRKEKKLAQLEKALTGIIEMDHLPKALYVIDAKREETAVKEASRLGIPIVGLVDTNSDPDPFAHVIPGNDDAIRSIQLVTSLLADAILEGVQVYRAGLAPPAAEAESPVDPIPAPEESPEAAPVETAIPPVEGLPVGDEVVEQIVVPEEVLKVEETGPVIPKKKRVAKPKADPKVKGKEE